MKYNSNLIEKFVLKHAVAVMLAVGTTHNGLKDVKSLLLLVISHLLAPRRLLSGRAIFFNCNLFKIFVKRRRRCIQKSRVSG